MDVYYSNFTVRKMFCFILQTVEITLKCKRCSRNIHMHVFMKEHVFLFGNIRKVHLSMYFSFRNAQKLHLSVVSGTLYG